MVIRADTSNHGHRQIHVQCSEDSGGNNTNMRKSRLK